MKNISKRVEKLNEEPMFAEWLSDEEENEMTRNTEIYLAEQRGIERIQKENAITMHVKGLENKLICDVLKISEDQLNKYLKEEN